MTKPRVVIDTYVLLSAAIKPHSTAAAALRKAVTSFSLFASDETLGELFEVLFRPKFDAYFVDSVFTRELFFERYVALCERLAHPAPVNDCADPKDNKFLALALAANACCLLSGDKKHLLAMNPYRGVAIVTVSEFLNTDWANPAHRQ